MIQTILQSLESELVNIASDHRKDRLDQISTMQLLVIEAACSFSLLEKIFGSQYFEDEAAFYFVRNRLLYYLVYFENEQRKLIVEVSPTIEELKPFYRLASQQDWKTAIKNVGCCWSKTVTIQRIVLSKTIPALN